MACSQEPGPQAGTHSSCRSSAARWARCWPKPVPPEEPVMKFDAPAGRNPIDRKRVVTRPVNRIDGPLKVSGQARRSEEHTSELQSLMRISYAVFCLKKKTRQYQIGIEVAMYD